MSRMMRVLTLLIDQNASCNESSSNKNWTPIWHPLEWEFLGTREIHPRDTFEAFDIFRIYSCGGRIRDSWSSPVEIVFKESHAENGHKGARQQNWHDYSTHSVLRWTTIASNENKMSDGGRQRASLGVGV